MADTRTFREASRPDKVSPSGTIALQQLAFGCLQRIADAAEKQAAAAERTATATEQTAEAVRSVAALAKRLLTDTADAKRSTVALKGQAAKDRKRLAELAAVVAELTQAGKEAPRG